MVMLISPAPGGTRGLAYGNTTVRPYSASRPHRGQDWEREWADLSKPRPVVASAGGRVTSVYAGDGNNQGWGRRVEITVPSTTHRIVVALNHLDSIATAVGRDIGAGGYVGEMGNSGETLGVHLHEELWIDGVRVDPNYYRTRDLPGTAATAGGGARPFDPEEDDMPITDEDARKIAAQVWGYGIGENGQPGVNDLAAWRRLGITQAAAEEAGRLGAQFALYTYGTGIVAVNKITSRWMILAPGYAELLQHLGLAAPGSRKIDEGQFKYVTQYVPAATGLPDIAQADGFTEADLDAIKKAITENRVALSQEQYDRLVTDVSKAAAAGGETGARAALAKLTLVVKAP